MDLSGLNSYLSTLSHYLLAAAGLIAFMYGFYMFQRRIGIKREAATGRTLIVPWAAGFVIFVAFPVGASLYLSFTNYNLFKPPEWIGLQNYADMFKDKYFWPNLRLTLFHALLSVPLGLIFALSIASLLARNVRAMGFWRTLYYLPAVIPPIATILLWRWLLSPDQGLINTFLSPIYKLLNVQPLQWFTDANLVLPSFILMSLWGVFGANTIILLAALKGVSPELYEAAGIDGAGGWAKFRFVTIPMITPAMFYNVITSIIAALGIFTQSAFISAPADAGTFWNYNIYVQAFTFRKMGYASALGWFWLIIIGVLTLFVFRSSAAWVFYEGQQEKS